MNIGYSLLGTRVLFLGCHLDDVEFGCGALVSQCAGEKKFNLRIDILSDHNENAANETQLIRDLSEAERSRRHLGCGEESYVIHHLPGQRFDSIQQEIRELLLQIRSSFAPDSVFFPAFGDVHQDHCTLSGEAYRIFRGSNCFGYEVIRSSRNFNPNICFEISEKDLMQKINAVMSYASQQQQSAAYYFSEELVRSIAIFRGGQFGMALAEAFEVYCYRVRRPETEELYD